MFQKESLFKKPFKRDQLLLLHIKAHMIVNVYRISSIMQAWKYASEVELFECYWLQLRQDK